MECKNRWLDVFKCFPHDVIQWPHMVLQSNNTYIGALLQWNYNYLLWNTNVMILTSPNKTSCYQRIVFRHISLLVCGLRPCKINIWSEKLVTAGFWWLCNALLCDSGYEWNKLASPLVHREFSVGANKHTPQFITQNESNNNGIILRIHPNDICLIYFS